MLRELVCLWLVHSSPSAQKSTPKNQPCLMPAAVLRNKAVYRRINGNPLDKTGRSRRCSRSYKKKKKTWAWLFFSVSGQNNTRPSGTVSFPQTHGKPCVIGSLFIHASTLAVTVWRDGIRIASIFTGPLSPRRGWETIVTTACTCFNWTIKTVIKILP